MIFRTRSWYSGYVHDIPDVRGMDVFTILFYIFQIIVLFCFVLLSLLKITPVIIFTGFIEKENRAIVMVTILYIQYGWLSVHVYKYNDFFFGETEDAGNTNSSVSPVLE